MNAAIGLEMGRIDYGLNNPDVMRLDIDPMDQRDPSRIVEYTKRYALKVGTALLAIALAACGTAPAVGAPAVDASPTSTPRCATARLGSSVMSLTGELGGGYNSIVTVDREKDGKVDFTGSPHEGGMIYFHSDGRLSSEVCLIK